MSDDKISVTIGRTKLAVPVHIDGDATHDLAAALTKRLHAIEEASPRIDSVAFALQAAFELAVEADIERRERAGDREDFERALHRIEDALREVIERRTPSQPHGPELRRKK